MYVIYNNSMDKKIISVREIQRNYRRLINQVKKTKSPLYLGARSRAEAVLLDADVFEDLDKKANGQKITWEEMEKNLAWIRKGGKKGVDLARFVYADRRRH